MKTNNYISYSLWGDQPIYNIGIIKNIQQAKEFYKGWKVIVYHDDTVPATTIEEIKRNGASVVNMSGISYGMFWRFLAADLPDCGHAIFRDTDSRLSRRESLAVKQWIRSGKSIHIMRDHPDHEIPFGSDRLSILGGMWGIKGGLIPMKEMIHRFSDGKNLGYGIDQAFLKEIYLMLGNHAEVHDEFFAGIPFPGKRQGFRFIGERINENDQPVGEYWVKIRTHIYEKRMNSKLFILLTQFRKLYRKLWSLVKG